MNHYVKQCPGKGKSVFSGGFFKAGDTVLVGKTIKQIKAPTTASLQIDEDLHVELDEPFCFLNHSCDPNCGLSRNEFNGYSLVALRQIQADEELSFDYAMSEWTCFDFACCCASKRCRSDKIAASVCNPEIVLAYSPWLSPFIEKKLLQLATQSETLKV